MSWPWSQVGEALCTCPFACWAVTWLPLGTELAEAAGRHRACVLSMSQGWMPGWMTGPAPVPAGPRSMKAVPRPVSDRHRRGALSWAGPPGAAVPRVTGFEDIISISWPARGGCYRCPTLAPLRDSLSLLDSSPRMFVSTHEKVQDQQRGRKGGLAVDFFGCCFMLRALCLLCRGLQ